MPTPVRYFFLAGIAAFFCSGCIGSKVSRRIDTEAGVTIPKDGKIALLAPVFLRHLGKPGLYEPQKDAERPETQCYMACVQLEPFFIAKHKEEFGSRADIIYYATNFSVTNRDLEAQSLVNLNLEDGHFSFRNTHGGRNDYIVNAPFAQDDRIHELSSLPAGYTHYITIITGSTPAQFSPAKNLYAFASALTLLLLPLPSSLDYQTSAILTDRDLKNDHILYVRQTKRKQFAWLPLILTLGLFENTIDQEEEAVSCFREALKQIKTDAKPSPQ